LIHACTCTHAVDVTLLLPFECLQVRSASPLSEMCWQPTCLPVWSVVSLGRGRSSTLYFAALLSDIGEQLCFSCVLCPCNHPYMLTHSPDLHLTCYDHLHYCHTAPSNYFNVYLLCISSRDDPGNYARQRTAEAADSGPLLRADFRDRHCWGCDTASSSGKLPV